jgi:hypothetical protein
MKRTFNNVLSTLEIWFFDVFGMILGYTSLIHGVKDMKILSLTVSEWLEGIKFLEY